MGISQIGGSTSASSGGSGTVTYAPLPTTSLTPVASIVTPDTGLALTLTGRRFAFEYEAIPSLSANTMGCAIGWTGSPTGLVADLEYVSQVSPYPVSKYANVAPSMPLSGGSPFAVYSASTCQGGPVILRGVIDYAATVTTTLTPYVFTTATNSPIYCRIFKVTVVA
jgi:hypothetical protein